MLNYAKKKPAHCYCQAINNIHYQETRIINLIQLCLNYKTQIRADLICYLYAK